MKEVKPLLGTIAAVDPVVNGRRLELWLPPHFIGVLWYIARKSWNTFREGSIPSIDQVATINQPEIVPAGHFIATGIAHPVLETRINKQVRQVRWCWYERS